MRVNNLKLGVIYYPRASCKFIEPALSLDTEIRSICITDRINRHTLNKMWRLKSTQSRYGDDSGEHMIYTGRADATLGAASRSGYSFLVHGKLRIVDPACIRMLEKVPYWPHERRYTIYGWYYCDQRVAALKEE